MSRDTLNQRPVKSKIGGWGQTVWKLAEQIWTTGSLFYDRDRPLRETLTLGQSCDLTFF